MKNTLLAACLVLIFTLPGYCIDYTVFDVVGDSISAGVNPDSPGASGWVQMLFGDFGSSPDTIDTIWPGISENNHAVSGSRASEWAAPGYTPMQQVLANQPDLVVVYIGGNDFLQDSADGTMSQAELDAYQAALETIIDTLQANTPVPEIILINYYDLFDGFSTSLPAPFAAYQGLSQTTIDGNLIISDVAAAKGCYIVDSIYDGFMHHCYGGELGDTGHLAPDYVATPLTSFDIHPNTSGHEAIHQEVFTMLQYLQGLTAVENWDCYQ